MEVLVIEDDRHMAELLRRGLEVEGHRVFVAYDGKEGAEFAQVRSYDVIVLDVMLPRLNGIVVARRLRDQGNRTPILMLTARDNLEDVVLGLDNGADDYLTKPFAFEELLARIRSVSRRGPVEKTPVLQVADLTLNPASHKVQRGDRLVTLTPREYQLLELLISRAGRVVSRDTILDVVWGCASDVEPNTVDAFVSTLRRNVEMSNETRLIHTVRAVGFCLRELQP